MSSVQARSAAVNANLFAQFALARFRRAQNRSRRQLTTAASQIISHIVKVGRRKTKSTDLNQRRLLFLRLPLLRDLLLLQRLQLQLPKSTKAPCNVSTETISLERRGGCNE